MKHGKLVLLGFAVLAGTAAAPIASLTLPTDSSGKPLPQPTSAFVALCNTDAAACRHYIILDSEVAMIRFMNAPPFCIPDAALASDEALDRQIQQIKTWLTGHAELANQETTISITSAYGAIYPNPSAAPCQ